ncbi:MAG: hypothetical protein HY698_09425 [Deltaproteobacteria bacterium]|nr:hypothetical protein [Deltaproteobacteria bacterium]
MSAQGDALQSNTSASRQSLGFLAPFAAASLVVIQAVRIAQGEQFDWHFWLSVGCAPCLAVLGVLLKGARAGVHRVALRVLLALITVAAVVPAARHGFVLPWLFLMLVVLLPPLLSSTQVTDALLVAGLGIPILFSSHEAVAAGIGKLHALAFLLVLTSLAAAVAATRRQAAVVQDALWEAVSELGRRTGELSIRDEILLALAEVDGSVEERTNRALLAIQRFTDGRTLLLAWSDGLASAGVPEDALVRSRHALGSGRPLTEVVGIALAHEKTHDMLPLGREGSPIAFLGIASDSRSEDMRRVSALCPALLTALLGALARERIQRQAYFEERLAQVARVTATSLDASTVLERVRDEVRKSLGARRCSISIGGPTIDTANIEGYMVVFPLHEQRHGRIVVDFSPDSRRLLPEESAFVQNVASHLSTALEACRLHAEVVRASRTKSEFLANTTHELRTPLHAILGHAELLGHTRLDERAKQSVLSIREAGSHLLTLVNNLIDLARIEAGELTVTFTTVDMREIIALAVRSALGALKDRPVEVRAEVPNDAQTQIETDPTRVKQILLNLVGNAAKFTEQGEIVFSVMERGEHLAISLRDTGPGIDPAYHGTIFEKFRQADGSDTRRAQGAGLGLAISRELAQLLGGDLAVASSLGEGATFTLTLPFRRRASPISPGDDAGRAHGPRGNEANGLAIAG